VKNSSGKVAQDGTARIALPRGQIRYSERQGHKQKENARQIFCRAF
jgi:hypothetical protein